MWQNKKEIVLVFSDDTEANDYIRHQTDLAISKTLNTFASQNVLMHLADITSNLDRVSDLNRNSAYTVQKSINRTHKCINLMNTTLS